jgi:hypothetical protein
LDVAEGVMNISSSHIVVTECPQLTWLPDETLFSLCSRQHLIMGGIGSSFTSKAIFGLPNHRILHDIPCGLSGLEQSEFRSWGSAESILFDHTIFPVFVPFQSRTTIESAIATVKGGYIGSLKYALGLVSGGFGAEHPLKACQDCMHEDLRTYGVAYWHLTHQYPGVEVCPSHRTWLMTATKCRQWSGRVEWSLPTNEYLIPKAPSQKLWSNSAFFVLARSVMDLAALGRRQTLQASAVAKVYRSAVVGDELPGLLLEYLAPLRRFHLFESLPADAQSLSSFLAQLTCNPRRSLHPLKHLTLINGLFGGVQPFLDAYQIELSSTAHETPQTQVLKADDDGPSLAQPIPAKGAPRPKRLKGQFKDNLLSKLACGGSKKELCEEFDITISTIDKLLRANPATYAEALKARHTKVRGEQRDEWQRLHNLHPDLGAKALRNHSASLYAWLYRNDKEWLSAQRECCPKPPRSDRHQVDWEARDHRLLEMIRKACRVIMMRQETIIKRDLYAMLPMLWSCLENRDRYPKSRAYLSTVSESPNRQANVF